MNFQRFIIVMVMMHVQVFGMHRTTKLQSVGPLDLKGTHTVLSDIDYAPFWGLIFSEQEKAKQWYLLSPKIIMKTIEMSLQRVSADRKKLNLSTLDLPPNTATENLILHMFHLVGGTFNITNAPHNPVRMLRPEHIGAILRIVRDGIAAHNIRSIAGHLERYLPGLNFLDPSGKQFKARDFRPFIESLVGSIEESVGQRAIYARNTPQGILLGFLLLKSQSRTDLQDYFRGFLGDDHFVLPPDAYTVQDFKQYLQQPLVLEKTPRFADYLCAITYFQKYESMMPKITNDMLLDYEGTFFVNCVESVMSNLLNIVTYDHRSYTFGNAPAGLTLSLRLQNFYAVQEHRSNANVDKLSVNRAWMDVLEDTIGVAYNRMAVPGNRLMIEVQSYECDGAIPVDSVEENLPRKHFILNGTTYTVFEKNVGTLRYWLVPRSSGLYCFEMMPSVSNIIVTINTLCNLNIYQSIRDILQPDFEQKYFEPLCAALGWSVSPAQIKDIASFQAGDVPTIDIMVELLSGERFTIHFHRKLHASLKVDTAKTKREEMPPELDEFDHADGAIQAACVASGIMNSQVCYVSKMLRINTYFPAIDFSTRLCLINQMGPFTDQSIDAYVARLIMSMSMADDTRLMLTMLEMIRDRMQVFEQLSTQQDKALGVMSACWYERGVGLEPIIYYISMRSCNRGALSFITFDSFIELVGKALQVNSPWVQSAACEIIKMFVRENLERGYVSEKVLQLVLAGICQNSVHTIEHLLIVLRQLIEQDLVDLQHVAEIIESLQSAINFNRFTMRQYNVDEAWNIMQLLVDKRLIDQHMVHQLIHVLKNYADRLDVAEQSSYIHILQNLAAQGLLYAHVHDAILLLDAIIKEGTCADQATSARSEVAKLYRMNNGSSRSTTATPTRMVRSMVQPPRPGTMLGDQHIYQQRRPYATKINSYQHDLSRKMVRKRFEFEQNIQHDDILDDRVFAPEFAYDLDGILCRQRIPMLGSGDQPVVPICLAATLQRIIQHQYSIRLPNMIR